MPTNLTATIDGQPVPLDECGWIERRPCGCIVAAVLAVVETVDDSGHVLATADQAHRHLNPTKRDRDKAARARLTTELITMRHYREDIGAKWECEQHATKPAYHCPNAVHTLRWDLHPGTTTQGWILTHGTTVLDALDGYPPGRPPVPAVEAHAWAGRILGTPQSWVEQPPRSGAYHTHPNADCT